VSMWVQNGKAPQIEVTDVPGRHSRMLLAGIQKESLDARSLPKAFRDKLRGHDKCILNTHLCGAVSVLLLDLFQKACKRRESLPAFKIRRNP